MSIDASLCGFNVPKHTDQCITICSRIPIYFSWLRTKSASIERAYILDLQRCGMMHTAEYVSGYDKMCANKVACRNWVMYILTFIQTQQRFKNWIFQHWRFLEHLFYMPNIPKCDSVYMKSFRLFALTKRTWWKWREKINFYFDRFGRFMCFRMHTFLVLIAIAYIQVNKFHS